MKRKYNDTTPMESPTEEEIVNAVRTLHNQWLHVYQLLLFHDPPLSNPSGWPLRVERIYSPFGITTSLRVSYGEYAEKLGLQFVVWVGMEDEEILTKARMLIDGKAMQMRDHRACCVYAQKVFCVCEASFECPLHGHMCIGSHD